MYSILISILGFLIAIGILTTVHEAGHFFAARIFNVKVLKFSIGFGPPLLRWYDRLGVEYILAAIPLGGYVKMLDDREVNVATNERHMSFNAKKIWPKVAIISAGPIANILFAIFAYWLVFLFGVKAVIPILGPVPVGSIADFAGMKVNQEIIKVSGKKTDSWEDISLSLLPYLGENGFVDLEVYDRSEQKYSKHVMKLDHWLINDHGDNFLDTLGIIPQDPILPIIGQTLDGYPAASAGLLPDDLIIAIEQQPIFNRSQATSLLQQTSASPVNITIQRDKEIINFQVIPETKILDNGKKIAFIGIQYKEQSWPEELLRRKNYGFLEALQLAAVKTKDYSMLTFQFLAKMVTGVVSTQYISGPISIARYAGKSVISGIEYFLNFLALISISLAVVNMLPIPILDGGQFCLCVVESLQGKPISNNFAVFNKCFGFILLLSIMLLAIYNDLLRL